MSKLYEISRNLNVYSRLTSYLWSLKTVMQGKVARPGAGVGGTHEAPSHSGGHAACTDKESSRIRQERTLSRVYVTFRGKVIYAVEL